jgi:HEAT repeat protein/TolA-binding protein
MYAITMLLAVSLVAQHPQAAAIDQANGALEHARLAQLGDLDALSAASATLSGLGQLRELADLSDLSELSELPALSGLSTMEELASLSQLSDVAGVAWEQDPADSLYRAARELLNNGRNADAAEAFLRLTRRYPRSDYAPDAYYWAAFALYRTGNADNYKQALSNLDLQRRRYPSANTLADARALEARIQGELARQGDPAAAEWVRTHAEAVAGPPGAPPSLPANVAATPPPPSAPGAAQAGCSTENDDDPRMVALNALLQMDADAAVPILKKVLARRDPCSVPLRRKAMFIVSQKRTEGTEDILLDAARTDPDPEVRGQAVFWLSQVGTERAIGALDSILQSAQDVEVQKKALFALSQIRGARAGQILRQYALRADAPAEAREQAIFWLGQQRSDENAAFLRDLYAKLSDQDLKERVIFSLSQMRTAENGRWLMDLARNEREPMEMRKKALFWAGQMGAPLADLVALYDRTTNVEMKEQLIFVYSQRHEPGAIDKLIDIAKRETDPDLRKKAIFWLGQSHDPRARQVLIDIINQ